MKAINKFFAIAAIAAATMFSVQTASAGVISKLGSTSEYSGATFVGYLGSDWSSLDEMLEGNANRDAIVLLGVEMYNKYKAGVITGSGCDEYWTKLDELGCPSSLKTALQVKMQLSLMSFGSGSMEIARLLY